MLLPIYTRGDKNALLPRIGAADRLTGHGLDGVDLTLRPWIASINTSVGAPFALLKSSTGVYVAEFSITGPLTKNAHLVFSGTLRDVQDTMQALITANGGTFKGRGAFGGAAVVLPSGTQSVARSTPIGMPTRGVPSTGSMNGGLPQGTPLAALAGVQAPRTIAIVAAAALVVGLIAWGR